MKTINLEFLEQYFDFVIAEVEKGEKFTIIHDDKRVVMVPYQEYENAARLVDDVRRLQRG